LGRRGVREWRPAAGGFGSRSWGRHHTPTLARVAVQVGQVGGGPVRQRPGRVATGRAPRRCGGG
jgi:hypothetical protein